MTKILTEDLVTRRMLDTMSKFRLNENEEQISDNTESETQTNEIPINDSTFPGILKAQKESLSQKLPNITFEDNPFILNKSNNTVTLKGKIQNLNLDFIMTTDTSNGGDGLYISTNSMNLNDKTIQTLNVLYAHGQIFQEEWTINEVQKKLKGSNI